MFIRVTVSPPGKNRDCHLNRRLSDLIWFIRPGYHALELESGLCDSSFAKTNSVEMAVFQNRGRGRVRTTPTSSSLRLATSPILSRAGRLF